MRGGLGDVVRNVRAFLAAQLRERPWAVYLAALGLLVLLAAVIGSAYNWRR